ncbi:hypothetical protein MUGA111182_09825 [Mucilaginibacter galii]|uniref:hypothetical protein n=1 Tax=Mucilaginibacter galii TaxID=2005073 RepID=UPI00363F3882
MHLAYSSLRNINENDQSNKPSFTKKARQLRYQGYQAACEKYQNEIATIQQYLPGWKPAFR